MTPFTYASPLDVCPACIFWTASATVHAVASVFKSVVGCGVGVTLLSSNVILYGAGTSSQLVKTEAENANAIIE